MKLILRVENKLKSHTSDQIKHREPGIVKLTKSYNEACDQMGELITEKSAPRGAVVPQHIQRDGLFKLDVDDDIWQDVGLDDDDGMPPRWLADDNCRSGIKYMLELDRCREEEV